MAYYIAIRKWVLPKVVRQLPVKVIPSISNLARHNFASAVPIRPQFMILTLCLVFLSIDIIILI